MTNEELIKELRKRGLSNPLALGERSGLNDCAADTIESLSREVAELKKSVNEWESIFDLLNGREYRKKYLEYWREKNNQTDLTYPDGDEVYKCLFESLDEIKKLSGEISELKKADEYRNMTIRLWTTNERNNRVFCTINNVRSIEILYPESKSSIINFETRDGNKQSIGIDRSEQMIEILQHN